MCGLNFCQGVDSPEQVILRMNAAIATRGFPGRSGFVKVSDDSALGHVRLPIQGLDRIWDQPYFYDGRWAICFVGEIFNYRELVPSAESDTQVLADAWDRDGIEAFRNFEGFWSVVIRDLISGRTHVITDYLAKKPLYLHLPTGSVSSEIKALKILDERPQADEIYFSAVQKWGYCPEDRTPFAMIRKIPPSSHIVFNQWGDVEFNERYTTLAPNPEIDLRSAIEKAVQNRLVSDVPVSVLASGGLDSTIILKLARQIDPKIRVLHVENGEAEYLKDLEVPDIETITLDPLDPELLGEIFAANEGPVDLGSVVPQYFLGKALNARGVQVAMSGDGADELFGGYRRAMEYDSQASDIFHELVYYHLPRLDKLMMAWTVELRSPFLARDVIEGAMALPWAKRMGKSHLKKIFVDLLPERIFNRAKEPLRYSAFRNNGINWVREAVNIYRRKEGI